MYVYAKYIGHGQFQGLCNGTSTVISVFEGRYSNDVLILFSIHACFVQFRCCSFLYSYYMFLGCCFEKSGPPSKIL